VRHFLALALALSTTACFDSDDLSSDLELPNTSTQGPKPHPPPESETEETGPPPPDMGEGDQTCGDAVECILDCAVELQANPNPEEVDLSCFFDCEEGLTVDEALLLVELGACVFQYCTDEGLCEATPENPLAPLDPEGDCVICIGAGVGGSLSEVCVSELEACD
jgi:hypothetical protein